MSENKSSKIRDMLMAGNTYKVICETLGVASSTVAYHAKAIGRQKFTFERKEHDWDAIQAYYDDGYTYLQVAEHFGIHTSVLTHGRNTGRFSTERTSDRRAKRAARGTDRRRKVSPEHLFTENSEFERATVRRHIIREGTIPYACSGICPLAGVVNPAWAGEALSLHLDHKNGVRNDHRLDNLRWLCPNCHSQTETYAGKNNLALATGIEPA